VNLVEKNELVANPEEESDTSDAPAYLPTSAAKKNVAVLASFSKNFLPCLFNIFGTATEDQRPYLQQAIEAYLSITEPKVSQ
jgi:hypothetical protein